MQMETLRLFCDVVATKNFTRVAEWNDHTQNHNSNFFLGLERAFGARRAEQHYGFFQLTPAGELCHRHFLEILRLYDTLEPQMQAARKAAADTIRSEAQ